MANTTSFQADKGQKVIQPIFEAKTINTPSMLCIEDAIKGLEWAHAIGGQDTLWQRVQRNFDIMNTWVTQHPDLEHLAQDTNSRSRASICFNLKQTYCQPQERATLISKIGAHLAELGVAYDIKNHFMAPSSFRVWCGPTIEAEDLSSLTQWLNWAIELVRPSK